MIREIPNKSNMTVSVIMKTGYTFSECDVASENPISKDGKFVTFWNAGNLETYRMKFVEHIKIHFDEPTTK